MKMGEYYVDLACKVRAAITQLRSVVEELESNLGFEEA